MTEEQKVFPVTLWYSTLGIGDGHDFATRGYLRSLMKIGFFGLRIPPSISTSVLMLDEEADPDIMQFASLTRPPDVARMKPLKLIKAGDPRIGTTKVIDGTDNFGKPMPMEVQITEGSIDLDVEQEYVSEARQEVRSVIIHHDPASLARHYTTLTKNGKPNRVGYVGLTVWETSHIPDAVAMILNELHSIVVPSEHSKKALVTSGVDVPVEVVRHTFDPALWPNPSVDEFGYKDRASREKYVFYAIATPIERKNLKGLMRAYFKAFENRDDVILMIKTSGQKAEIKPVAKHALEESAITGKRPALKVLSGNWPTEKIRAFHLHGDCYVSANRGEGFGLISMEAKLCGSRVITSEWGAEKEFLQYQDVVEHQVVEGGPYRGHAVQNDGPGLTTGSDILIPCELIPVKGMYGIGCYDEDQLWADPSEDALIAAMRKAADQRLGPDMSAWSRLRDELSIERIGTQLASVILRAREETEREGQKDVF
jgi:glycosyltransferase involved in cell wall biosynthesis